MTRLGRAMLLGFLLVAGAFALLVRRGGSPPPRDVPVAGREAGPLAIPVAGVRPDQLHDSWGDPRSGGARAHHAIDIPAPRGTAVLAAAAGSVEKLFESGPGGHTVYVRADPATIHYYAHLDGYAPGLREGMAVRRGQPLGTVGSSGDASPDAPHLHFEIKRMAAGERWWQGTEVDPYPLLRTAAGVGTGAGT